LLLICGGAGAQASGIYWAFLSGSRFGAYRVRRVQFEPGAWVSENARNLATQFEQ